MNNLSVPHHRGSQQEGVNAVENAAVARKEGAGVLDAGRAFEGGLDQIADLCGDVDGSREREPVGVAVGIEEPGHVEGFQQGSQTEQARADEQAADERGDGSLPGLAGTETRGKLVASPEAANVEGGDIPCPDHAKEKRDQGGAVALGMEGGQGGEGKADVGEAEDGRGGVRDHLLDGAKEGAIDKQEEAENHEDGGSPVRPLQIAEDEGEKSQGDDDAGRGGTGMVRQAEKLPAGQRCDTGHGQRKQPLPAWPEKHQNQDKRDQDESGKDAFHSGMRIHRRGGERIL